MKFPTREEVENVKAKYKEGMRVELVEMDDPQAPKVGTRGTVRGVDSIGDIMVSWDNGSSLNVVYDVDKVLIVDDEDDIEKEFHKLKISDRDMIQALRRTQVI